MLDRAHRVAGRCVARAAYPRLPVGRAIQGRRVDVVGEDGAPRAQGQPDQADERVTCSKVWISSPIRGEAGASASDNILSLGGDSLQALELMLEIARRWVLVSDEAQDPTRTIAQWARDIAAWRRAQATCAAK